MNFEGSKRGGDLSRKLEARWLRRRSGWWADLWIILIILIFLAYLCSFFFGGLIFIGPWKLDPQVTGFWYLVHNSKWDR